MMAFQALDPAPSALAVMPEGTRALRVQANGLDFEVFELGTGDRLALCLHGFPEHALSWRHQMPVLAGLGYRVWAVNQRGYGGSSRPPRVADYDIGHLMRDVAALIEASGARETVLIAHDWGAIVAWCFAARAIRPITRLVIMNVPHPERYRARLWHPSQLRKSWYVLYFQIPGLAEWIGARDGARAAGEVFVRAGGDPARFPPEIRAAYRREAARPGALTAMINWYRAAFRGGLKRQYALGFPMIEAPTLLIWGEADIALDKETTYGTERHVRDLTIRYLPGVSHWVQQDAPEAVNALLTEFLGPS